MSSANYRVRRAIVDDRPWLVPLWQSLNLPAAELDPRLTEFQVIETADGQPLGAVGFQIIGRQGRIHSEAIADFGFADHFRPLLWERIQVLAASHLLTKVWTQESPPFWSRNGFLPAPAEALPSLPAAWQGVPGKWLVIPLREEASAGTDVDKQIEALRQQERERTQQLFQHAKTLKTLATLLAVALALFVMAAAAFLLRKSPALLGR